MTIIEVHQLTKQFKSHTAVENVSFNVTRGEIFGLIGPNGAGKSTLLKIIGGLIHQTSGEISFFNRDQTDPPSYFERMGLLIEQPGVYPQYSAYENIELNAISYGLKKRKSYITDLLHLVGLDPLNPAKVKNYSMGMKQRLGIAMALVGSPDVLILDEPINGLDPQGIVEIRQLILELNQQGMTIIISSHILEELSKVADKYAIIHQGKIIEVLSKDELTLQCEERIEIQVDQAEEAVPVLEQDLNIVNYKVMDHQTIYVYDPHVDSQQVNKALSECGIYVHSIFKQQMSLEQYFLQRTSGSDDND